jgi:hypothetical protein
VDLRPEAKASGTDLDAGVILEIGMIASLEGILSLVDEDRDLHSSITVSVRRRGFHFLRAKFVTSHVVASSLRQAS